MAARSRDIFDIMNRFSPDVLKLVSGSVIPIIKDRDLFSKLGPILDKTYEFPLDDYPVVIELSEQSRQLFKKEYNNMFKMLVKTLRPLKKPVIAGSSALRFLMNILKHTAPINQENAQRLNKIASTRIYSRDRSYINRADMTQEEYYYTHLCFRSSKIKDIDTDIWDLGSEEKTITSIEQNQRRYDIVPMKITSPLKLILDFDLPECRVCIPLSTDGTKILTTYQCLRAIFTPTVSIPLFLGPVNANMILLLTDMAGFVNNSKDYPAGRIIGVSKNPLHLNQIVTYCRIYGVDFLPLMEKFIGHMSRSASRLVKYEDRLFSHQYWLGHDVSNEGAPIAFVDGVPINIVPNYSKSYHMDDIANINEIPSSLAAFFGLFYNQRNFDLTIDAMIKHSAEIEMQTELFVPGYSEGLEFSTTEQYVAKSTERANIEKERIQSFRQLMSEEERSEMYITNINETFILLLRKVDEELESDPPQDAAATMLVDDTMGDLKVKLFNPFEKYDGTMINNDEAKVCNKYQVYSFFSRSINGSYYHIRPNPDGMRSEDSTKKNVVRVGIQRRAALLSLEKFRTDPDVLAHAQVLNSAGFFVNEHIYKLVEKLFLYE